MSQCISVETGATTVLVGQQMAVGAKEADQRKLVRIGRGRRRIAELGQRDAVGGEVVGFALEITGQPTPRQADVVRQVDAKKLIGVGPEVGFAHRIGVVGKDIGGVDVGRSLLPAGTAVTLPASKGCWQGRQHCQVAEIGVVAMHADNYF